MDIRITDGQGATFQTLDTDALPLDGNLYFVLPDGRDFSLFFHGDTVTLGAYREETDETEAGWVEAADGRLELGTLPANERAAWEPEAVR